VSGLILLGGWLSLFWLAIVWWMTLDKPANTTTTSYIALASMFAVVLNSPGIWLALANGYAGDSFATLGMFGKAGVILISTAGLAAIYAISGAKSKRVLRDQPTRPALVVLDVIVSIGIFGLVYAISPQVFYTFYQFLIPDLPDQTVLRWPLAVEQFRTAIAMSPSGSLHNHLAGIGWLGIVPFTLWFHARTVIGTGPAVLLLVISWFVLQIAHFI
jgi:hypothetical protein